MDCDCTPLREGWIDELATPVLRRAAASGIRFPDYMHPAFLCTRRSLLTKWSVDVRPDYPHHDVLQHLTHVAEREDLPLAPLEDDLREECMFDGCGQTYGRELVYHHWFGTRVNTIAGLEGTPEGRTREGLVGSMSALQAWLLERGLWREVAPGRGLSATRRTMLATAAAWAPGWLARAL